MAQVIDYLIDKALTQMSVAYKNGENIGTTLLPRVEVSDVKGYYYVFDKSRFNINDSRRTGTSRANRISDGMTKASYGPLDEHSLEEAIEYDVLKTYPSPHDARVDATEAVTEALDLGLEAEIAAMLTDTAVITQNITLSGSDQFSDYSGSDPFAVFQVGIDTIKANSGVTPNTLTLGYQVWSKLRHHPDLLGRMSVASVRVLTEEMLASLIGVEKVLIGDAVYNTSDEGQTAVMGYVWGKHALLSYTTLRPGLKKISLGYTLQLENGRYVDRWDEPWVKAQFVRANDYYEPKIVAAEAGYLIKNAVA